MHSFKYLCRSISAKWNSVNRSCSEAWARKAISSLSFQLVDPNIGSLAYEVTALEIEPSGVLSQSNDWTGEIKSWKQAIGYPLYPKVTNRKHCSCHKLDGRHLIDQKVCWPNEKWQLTERFFLPKTVHFVWNNSFVGACLSVITPNLIFRSIVKFHFGLTEKIFNLRLTKGIIDRKFPTFYVPIYPYKTYGFW